MRKGIFWALMALLLSCTACKEKEEYERVTVRGRVFDVSRQQPVANQLVYVYDNGGVSMAWFYQHILDSTRTDAQGLYELGFDRKELHQTHVACGLNMWDPVYLYAKKFEGSVEVKGGGGTVDFNLKKISVLRVRLKVIDNPYPPMKVWDSYRVGVSKAVLVHGLQNDTVFFLRGVPNEENVLGLEVKSPDNSYNRQKWEYFQLGSYADTIDVTMTANPGNFPGKG